MTRLAISIVAFALLPAVRRRRLLSMEFADTVARQSGEWPQRGTTWPWWKVLFVLFFFGFALPWIVMVLGLLAISVGSAVQLALTTAQPAACTAAAVAL